MESGDARKPVSVVKSNCVLLSRGSEWVFDTEKTVDTAFCKAKEAASPLGSERLPGLDVLSM